MVRSLSGLLRRVLPRRTASQPKDLPVVQPATWGRGDIRPSRDRREEFTAHLPPLRRTRSTLSQHEHAKRACWPKRDLSFGLEGQTSTMTVVPGGVRHQKIGEADNTIAELDPSESACDLEFVSKPSADHFVVMAHAREVMATTAALRKAWLAQKTDSVSVTTADNTLKLEDAERYQRVRFATPAPSCRIQSTVAVRLRNIDTLLLKHPNRALHTRVRNEARQVIQDLNQRLRPIQASDNVEHFVKWLLYYMGEADKQAKPEDYPKSRFRFMLRSDFRSIYLQLLTSDERQLVKELLLPREGEAEGLLLKSTGRRASQPFFRCPYDVPGENGEMVLSAGASMQAALQAIVQGRDGKDMSAHLQPFAGIPVPGNNTTLATSMGAWGVHPDQHSFAIEIRGDSDIDKSTFLNSHYLTAVKKALRFARTLNADLGQASEVLISQHEQQWANASAAALHWLRRYRSRIASDLDQGEIERALKREQDADPSALDLFKAQFDKAGWKQRYPDVERALRNFDAAGAYAKPAPEAAHSTVQQHLAAVDQLLDALWNVDATLTTEVDIQTERLEAERHKRFLRSLAAGTGRIR